MFEYLKGASRAASASLKHSIIRKCALPTRMPLAATFSAIGTLANRSLSFHAPPCRSSITGNGPAPCGWKMRAISVRLELRRNSMSQVLISWRAAGL